MTTATAERADLRALSDGELAALYAGGGEPTQAAVLAECDRRDRAVAASGKARDKRRAVTAEWYDAAHAQFLAAEAGCKGNLLSRAGEAAGIADPIQLWRASEARARKLASEELRNFWDDHGGRLSLAEFKRQRAMAARVDRDERDLAGGAPKRSRPKWAGVRGGAVRETPVRIGDLRVTAWAAMDLDGITTIHPSRPAAERHLAPAEDVAPLVAPDITTGTTGERITVHDQFSQDLTVSAARRRDRVDAIKARVAMLAASRVKGIPR
jgi:hypothetical protein